VTENIEFRDENKSQNLSVLLIGCDFDYFNIFNPLYTGNKFVFSNKLKAYNCI
jgi:hypothetical protein